MGKYAEFRDNYREHEGEHGLPDIKQKLYEVVIEPLLW